MNESIEIKQEEINKINQQEIIQKEKEKKNKTSSETKEKPKKQFFLIRFIKFIGNCIKWALMATIFGIIYIIGWPFTRCKIKGKENINKDDEARVFTANHYQLYGPMSVFMNFPYKNRPWIIDKMMDEKSVEHQMGLMVYNEFKKVPKFIKWIVLKLVKNLMVFVMRLAKGIPVSRENPRNNIKAFQISTETLNKNWALLIYPEKDYVNEGVGIFMQGFEHIGKYYYGKTGKKISFYPMFISQKNKTMYIGKPIIYNPDVNHIVEKERIVSYLRNEMVKQYEEFEVNAPSKKKNKKLKNDKSAIEVKKIKKEETAENLENIVDTDKK